MAELLDLRKEKDIPEPEEVSDISEEVLVEGEMIAWNAPEVHHELISHGLRKFIIVLFFAMAVLAVVWQKSLLSAITFAAIALVTSLHFHKEPKHGEYSIHPKGIAINDRVYEYQNLESFCIHHYPDGLKELSLQGNKKLMPYIKIPLGEQDPEIIRDALSMYLIEDSHEHGPDDYLRIKLGL